jgi:hypothetical protein
LISGLWPPSQILTYMLDYSYVCRIIVLLDAGPLARENGRRISKIMHQGRHVILRQIAIGAFLLLRVSNLFFFDVPERL